MRRIYRAIPAIIIATGSIFCSSDGDHRVFVWGSSRHGQLGIGIENNISVPTEMKNMRFKDISARRACTAGVTADGRLYTWGNGRNGLLGHTGQINILVPKQVPIEKKIEQVSCGYQHVCAVSKDGLVYLWGGEEQEKKFRMIGTKETQKTKKQVKIKKIENLSSIKEVACSAEHSVALSTDGTVFTWGKKRLGRNGDGSPQPLLLKDIVKVVCGIDFTIALDSQGRLYTWGSNSFGQLGIPTIKSADVPLPIEYLAGEQVIDVSCGDNYAGAITRSGKVFTWGFGNEGQLGHGDKFDQNIPRKLQLEQQPVQISCGGSHTAILTKNNKLFIFGRGRQGQIGIQDKDLSNSVYRLKPIQLKLGQIIRKVICGGNHTVALVE